MSEQTGREIPELRITPDRYLPHRYAGASGDFNPIHIDREFAESVGLPGTILHGLYVMALVARTATDAAGGDPRSLRRLKVQFRGMSLPEKEIVITGERCGDGPGEDGLEEIALEAIQDGTRVIRNAKAVIRPKP